MGGVWGVEGLAGRKGEGRGKLEEKVKAKDVGGESGHNDKRSGLGEEYVMIGRPRRHRCGYYEHT